MYRKPTTPTAPRPFWLAMDGEGYSRIFRTEDEAVDLPLDCPATNVFHCEPGDDCRGQMWDVTEQHALWWWENHGSADAVPPATYQRFLTDTLVEAMLAKRDGVDDAARKHVEHDLQSEAA